MPHVNQQCLFIPANPLPFKKDPEGAITSFMTDFIVNDNYSGFIVPFSNSFLFPGLLFDRQLQTFAVWSCRSSLLYDDLLCKQV